VVVFQLNVGAVVLLELAAALEAATVPVLAADSSSARGARRGATCSFLSSSLSLIAAICDRHWVLRGGYAQVSIEVV
jgi:ABC-type sugar transport system ATPase subunit